LVLIFSFGIGDFLKGAAFDPERHRCGLFLVMNGLALVWTIGSIIVTAGLLALFESSRGVAKHVLLRTLPLLLLAAVAAGLVGRYHFW
jgi:hypothetical protein